MARNVLKSNNTVVLMTPSPAFSTQNKTGVLFAGVTDSSFEFKLERSVAKQIGTQNLSHDTLVRHPDVSLSLGYILEPNMWNEKLLGLNVVTGGNAYCFSGINDLSYNFFYLNHPNEGEDAIDEMGTTTPNFNGYDVISIGNAYLNSYKVNFAVGSIPSVSLGFDASNIEYVPQIAIFPGYSGIEFASPAINLVSGNNAGVGNVVFDSSSNETGRQSPTGIRPNDIEVTLQNLQVGGQVLSGFHFIQSLDISIGIDRVALYKLGSNYVCGRKAQFPLNGTISINSLVSGFQTGQISGLLNNESSYDFEVVFTDYNNNVTGKFLIEDAKLNGGGYSMRVNDKMDFSADFSFEINEGKGFKAIVLN